MGASEFTIRRAVPADAASLRALRRRSLEEHPKAFLVTLEEDDEPTEVGQAAKMALAELDRRPEGS